MKQLLGHVRGSQYVDREALDLVEMPEATDTYTPVSHFQLAERLLTIGQDILTDYTLAGEGYVLARKGNQLFAALNFKNSSTEMGLSIGFRNSYDRSMSLGLAVGANVFVCDNMALSGDITVMKKHTKHIWDSLEDVAIATLYKSEKKFHQLIEDAEAMKARELVTEDGFRTMGMLYGEGILSPRQLPVVKDEWLHPRHAEFEHRNQWSFYNACTEALKSCAPNNIMEKHIQLHGALVQEASQDVEVVANGHIAQ